MSRRSARGGGSTLGSIITFPFVIIASIIKFPFVIVAFVCRMIASILGAFAKVPFAAVGAVWRMIAFACRSILRIPVGSIAKMLFAGVAFVWRLAALALDNLLRVAMNPRGFAVGIVILVVVLAATNPESTFKLLLIAAGLTAGAFWLSRQTSAFRVTRNQEPGRSISRSLIGAHTRDLSEIYSLTPREFEEFVRDLLTELGYKNLLVVGGPGDLGVDIFGHEADGRSVAVQCKRYSPTQRIGSPTIQTFIGMQRIQHRADVGIFVTTADFTRDARSLAAQHDIWLINGGTLVDLHGKRSSISGHFRL